MKEIISPIYAYIIIKYIIMINIYIHYYIQKVIILVVITLYMKYRELFFWQKRVSLFLLK